MAQHAILDHPDVAVANHKANRASDEWSARVKFLCFVGCAVASWALIAVPFFVFA